MPEMSERTAVGHGVEYDLDPTHTVLVGLDLQLGFGDGGWERVPFATAAVENFRAAAKCWRAAGGTVAIVHTTYNQDRCPTGNTTDFAPDIATGLAEGSVGARLYDGVAGEGDIVIPKTTFSAVASSNILAVLEERGFSSAIVAGLTTPICVQATVDGLSMAGVKVAVLEDGCASQPVGRFSAADAHDMAIHRMGYLFAQILTTEELLSRL